MKKILLFIMIGMFLLSLTSASISNLGSFQQGFDVELIQTCEDCTYNNISKVLFPNGTTALNEVVMEKDDTFYNFTFTNTTTLGTYQVNGFGDPLGERTIWNYQLEITATGETLDTQQSLIVLGLMAMLLFLTGSFLYFGNKVETTSVKIFLLGLGSLFLIFTLGFSINIVTQLMQLESVFSGTFVNLYRLGLILLSGGMIAVILYLVTMAVTAFRKSRGILDEGDDL